MPNAENQLRSVQGYAPGAVIHPRPNEALAPGHLAHIAWLYSGFTTFSTGGVTPAAGTLLPVWTRRRRG